MTGFLCTLAAATSPTWTEVALMFGILAALSFCFWVAFR